MPHVATVTIPASNVPSDQIDFNVFIDLSDLPTAEFWGTVLNGGGDIRCYKSDGTTQLAREIISCDTTTDTGSLFVRFSGTLSSSQANQIQIWTGEGTEPAATATYGRNNVWVDDDRVYQLNSSVDSTGNQSLSTVGTVTLGGDTTSPIGAGATMGSDLSYLNASAPDYSNLDVTIRVWVKSSTASNDYITMIGDTGVGGRWLGIFANASGNLAVGYDDGSSASFVGTSYDITDGEWHSITVTFDADGLMSVYADGALRGSQSISAIGDVFDPGDLLLIGARFAGGSLSTANSWPGSLAGIHYRSGLLSDDWQSIQFANESSPSTFYTVAAVGGTTPVGSSSSLPSNIRVLLSSDSELSSNLLALVSSDLSSPSDIRSLVGDNLELLSDILSLSVVGAAVQLLSGVREGVNADVALSAGILDLVGEDASLASNISALAGQSLQILSDILQSGLVGADLSVLSGIRQFQGNDLGLASHILNSVASDAQLTADLLNLVGQDIGLQANTIALAGASVELRSQILVDVVFRSLKRDGGLKLVKFVQENDLIPIDRILH